MVGNEHAIAIACILWRRRISQLAKGIKNERTGERFHYSSIQNILRNIMYVGILRSGEARSEVISELQIVTQEQYDRVAKGRAQRSADYEKNVLPDGRRKIRWWTEFR